MDTYQGPSLIEILYLITNYNRFHKDEPVTTEYPSQETFEALEKFKDREKTSVIVYLNEHIKWLRFFKEKAATRTEGESWSLLEVYTAKILGSTRTGKANFERRQLAASAVPQEAVAQQDPGFRKLQQRQREEQSILRKEDELDPQRVGQKEVSNPQLRHRSPRKNESWQPNHNQIHEQLQQSLPKAYSPSQKYISPQQSP